MSDIKNKNLEPIPEHPGWFIDLETMEVFNESEAESYESEASSNGKNYNHDRPSPNEEHLKNSDQRDKPEGSEEDSGDGEDFKPETNKKNKKEKNEASPEEDNKKPNKKNELVEDAKREAKERIKKEIKDKIAKEVAKKLITSNPYVIGGVLAVVVIIAIILIFIMALMGYGTGDLSSPQERAYGAPTTIGEVPLFKQGDPRWGNFSFRCNGTTLDSAGCGPTSIAMIISYHLGRNVYPPEIAQKVLDNGWRECGAGTDWTAMTEIPKMYGLQSKEVTWTQAKKYLEQGKPIMQSQRGPHFTTGGHIIVITGKMGDTYLINDPGGRNITTATESQITVDIGTSWVVWK